VRNEEEIILVFPIIKNKMKKIKIKRLKNLSMLGDRPAPFTLHGEDMSGSQSIN